MATFITLMKIKYFCYTKVASFGENEIFLYSVNNYGHAYTLMVGLWHL